MTFSFSSFGSLLSPSLLALRLFVLVTYPLFLGNLFLYHDFSVVISPLSPFLLSFFQSLSLPLPAVPWSSFHPVSADKSSSFSLPSRSTFAQNHDCSPVRPSSLSVPVSSTSRSTSSFHSASTFGASPSWQRMCLCALAPPPRL